MATKEKLVFNKMEPPSPCISCKADGQYELSIDDSQKVIKEIYCDNCKPFLPKYTVNKYNDRIYTNIFPNKPPQKNAELSISVKVNMPDIVIPKGFELVGKHKTCFVYANEFARNKLPPLVNMNIAEGSVIVTLIVDEKGIAEGALFVMAHDCWEFTNPQGWKDTVNESFKDCALRELREETGISACTTPVKFDEEIRSTCLYELQWVNKTNVFYTTVTRDAANKALLYTDPEIEYIRDFSCEYLSSASMRNSIGAISDRHIKLYFQALDLYRKEN
jgi:8-oxo-dGTP pyrophosphatase MutT (NUDIX family)